MSKRIAAALAIAAVAALPAAALAPARAQALRIALEDDVGQLDPATSTAFLGRVVFASLCDKLIDVSLDLQYIPQLATKWEWSADKLALDMTLRQGVVFHDGEKLDAEAVKLNIERYKTAPFSLRKSELQPVKAVEVLEPYKVRLVLEQPYAPLLGVLSDRAGMMVSPRAAAEAGDKFALKPICAGPFRLIERVANDRIVLERFPQYWDAGTIHLDRISYLPIPDTTIRLFNLLSGNVEIVDRVAATDLDKLRADPRVKLLSATSIGYYNIVFNTGNGELAQKPFGKSAKLREAFELAIDRDTLNQVVFNGEFVPNNQPVLPDSPYYAKTRPMPKRDLARAKALVAEAGGGRVAVRMYAGPDSTIQRVAQVIQLMVADAGFDLTLDTVDGSTMVSNTSKGNYEAAFAIWSGRVDPDGNIGVWLSCNGFLNWGKYCDKTLDDLLTRARTVIDVKERAELYRQAAEIYLDFRPQLFLYHPKWFWGVTAKLEGFRPHPDGLIRPQGIKLAK